MSGRNDNMRRSYRSNVDEDIAKYEERMKDIERESRQNERMRFLFGGGKEKRGLGGFGRNDADLESTRQRRDTFQRALGEAREYRKMYPDEPPVGSPGRPDLIYKKGGAVKKMASGGRVRGDGCVIKGKTKGRIV